MLRGGTQWSPEPSSDPHPLSRLVLKALGPLNCRWVTPEERKWAGGCYPGPSNPVASRKFPPPRSLSSPSGICQGLSPSEGITPLRPCPPRGGATQHWCWWSAGKEQPGPGSSSLCCERGSGALAKSFACQLPHRSPCQLHWARPADCKVQALPLPCGLSQNYPACP